MTFLWKNFSGCKVWAILGRSKSLGVLYCCWVIYLQLPPPSCGTCATLSSSQLIHNANGHTVVYVQLGDREAERQADRRTPKKADGGSRYSPNLINSITCKRFVYSSTKQTTKFLTSVAKFIVPDWGVKSSIAQGCHTGPSRLYT